MIEFYNVRKRKKVQISTDQVTKRLLENKTKSGDIRLRYAFAAIDEDGTKMLKFCKKEDYDSFR
jgi:hypothetical protein|tara:strand:- start:1063 stop:1254 length:192 start_codon:yes stop_codon:yes gene_type:complete